MVYLRTTNVIEMYSRPAIERASPPRVFSVAALLVALTVLIPSAPRAQKLFSYDEFVGGVTAGGFAPDFAGYGVGSITLHFPAAATIRSAYLICGDHNGPPVLNIKLNGLTFQFSDTTEVTGGFSSVYGSPASVHVIDVRSAIDPASSVQSLDIPEQTKGTSRFTDFYLIVCYEVPGAMFTRVSIFLNDQNFQPEIKYVLPLTKHSVSTYDLALGLTTGYICSASDGEIVTCAGATLGTIWGPEQNSGDCGGPYANFYYDNGQLHGLGDDNEDLAMNHADVLSNIRSLVGFGAKTLQLDLAHVPAADLADNSIWGVVLVDGDTVCRAPAELACDPQALHFATISLCSADSIECSITNPGCDSLVIDDVSATGDPDLSVSGPARALVLRDDSVHFVVRLQPVSKGPKAASITVTAHSYNDPSHPFSRVIPVEASVGDGSRILAALPDLIDFGTVCPFVRLDTVFLLLNRGCDTILIDGTLLLGSGYVLDTSGFPARLIPGDTLLVHVHTQPDTAGHAATTLGSISVVAVSDNTIAPLTLKSSNLYPTKYTLILRPLGGPASSTDTVSFELSVSPPLVGRRTLDLDLVGNTDLLTPLGGHGRNATDVIGTHLHLAGDPYLTDSSGVLCTLDFQVYLTSDSATILAVSNPRLDSIDPVAAPCDAIFDLGSARFDYEYRCGERTIGNFMGGVPPLRIRTIHPNPATDVITIEIDSKQAASAHIRIVNALGGCVRERMIDISSGKNQHVIDIHDVSSGMYQLELRSGAGRVVVPLLITR